MEPVIIVHGGAAIIADERICGKMCGIKAAAKRGFEVLLGNGSAVDAVEAAINVMENDEYFNAGYGSILTLEGKVEMDASIMDGSDFSAGACAIVTNVKNPISLARLIREKSPHVLIAGIGASEFAEQNGLEIVPPESLASSYSKKILEAFLEGGGTDENREMGGTVGCVALDTKGNLAAGTSTGGTNGKLKGRIGDTPQIGSGSFADNNIGGVSSTGNGEAILKCCNAFAILKDMELGADPMTATIKNIENLNVRTGKTAGAITLSKDGKVGFSFNTKMMPWAYIKGSEIHFGLEAGQDFKKKETFNVVPIEPPPTEDTVCAAEENSTEDIPDPDPECIESPETEPEEEAPAE